MGWEAMPDARKIVRLTSRAYTSSTCLRSAPRKSIRLPGWMISSDWSAGAAAAPGGGGVMTTGALVAASAPATPGGGVVGMGGAAVLGVIMVSGLGGGTERGERRGGAL